MKKLLLLIGILILTLGCSSSDPIVTSEQATPVSEATEATTAIPVPNIQIVNYSSFSTKDIHEWVGLAESKMKSRKANIFAFIYPVGKVNEPEKRIRSDYADRVHREHEVLLSQDEIEAILSEIELWIKGDSCVHKSREVSALSDYRTFLEKGADASFQHALCETTRIVMMAVPERMRDHEPIENFQSFLLHEFYHAFQQDLEMEGECRRKRVEADENSNSVWMFEGGAHYFAIWLVAEIHGKTNYLSQILDLAYHAFERSERLVQNTEPDKWGAAALNLMVKQGMITEESILDGSLFHKCARELEFDYNSPDIQYIKHSWHLIENNSGIFQFKAEALDN